MFAPLAVNQLQVRNRIATSAVDSGQGCQTGAGLVLSEFVAVNAQGRITPETPVIDRAYQERLRRVVEELHHAGSRFALQLGHAGRRGSTRPRREGVDRPLIHGGWKLLAPSGIAYTPRAPLPKTMTVQDMDHVVRLFASAARAAGACWVDALELNMAHGYLLASFLSPATNRRDDDFGGPLENRLRFPLQVLDAVRAEWPRALIVKLSASDWFAGGLDLDDAVAIAGVLKSHGADMIHPVMGQTTWEGRPDYRRLFAVPASDRIRNEVGIPTLAEGAIMTNDDANTVLAAGRADMCLMEG